MMPAFLFMAIGWWQETGKCVEFLYFYIYPNNYYRIFVLDSTEIRWSDRKTSWFTASARYFTTSAAGIRGLIDIASH